MSFFEKISSILACPALFPLFIWISFEVVLSALDLERLIFESLEPVLRVACVGVVPVGGFFDFASVRVF